MKKVLISVAIVLVLLVVVVIFYKRPTKKVEEDPFTNKIERQAKDSKDSVKYTYSTSLYDITLDVKFNSDRFTFKNNILKSDDYDVAIDVKEYKGNQFTEMQETLGTEPFDIKGYNAIKMKSDVEVTTIIAIDDSTILTVVGKIAEKSKYIVDSISTDEDYNSIIDNMNITVNKK